MPSRCHSGGRVMDKAKVDDTRSAYSEHQGRLVKDMRELLRMGGGPAKEEPPNDAEESKADEKPSA